MAKKITVIKANRRKEPFSRKKLYASIYRACLETELPRITCKRAADQIYGDVLKILHKQQCVLSEEIAAVVGNAMQKRKKELAFMYKTHRDIS